MVGISHYSSWLKYMWRLDGLLMGNDHIFKLFRNRKSFYFGVLLPEDNLLFFHQLHPERFRASNHRQGREKCSQFPFTGNVLILEDDARLFYGDLWTSETKRRETCVSEPSGTAAAELSSDATGRGDAEVPV